MSIAQVIAVINQMEADGVVEQYAVGGAVGATFYLDPVATLDVDIFVAIQPEPGKLLLTVQPILDYLIAHGGVFDGEHIVIEGWPVQILPPTGPLIEDALAAVTVIDVDGTPAKVFSAEYLAAIALQTGRAKDKARLLQFLEEGVIDRARFQAILDRHGLVDRWQEFERSFLGKNS